MNTKLEENIIKEISPLNMERGLKLLGEGRLKKTQGKKVDGIYILMSSVDGKNRSEIYNSVIRIDTKTFEILGVSCQCEGFKTGRVYKKNYFCEHLSALGQSFILSNKRKRNKVNNNEEKKSKAIVLKRYNKLSFNIDFYDGREDEYFLVNFTGLQLPLGKLVLKDRMQFIEEDRSIIDYIKGDINNIKGNSLKVYKSHIRSFFECIKEEKFKLRYDYKSYNVRVVTSDLPLEFSIKVKEDNLIIRDKKNHPILLNSEGDTFVFSEKIYLISEKQKALYKEIYLNLRRKNEISISIKDRKNISSILEKISVLGADLIVDSGLSNLLETYIEREFYFYKSDEKISIYGKVKIFNKEYSLANIKDGDNTFPSYVYSNFKLISILNMAKFYGREGYFVYFGDEEEYFNFLKESLQEIRKYGKVFFKEEKIVKACEELKVNFEALDYNKNNFNIRLYGEHFNELENIYEAYLEGDNYYKTENDEYINLNSKALIEKINFFKALNIRGKLPLQEIHEGKAFYISDYINRAKEKVKGQELIKSAVEEGKILKRGSVPRSFQKILKDYQKEGYFFLKSLSNLSLGGLLGDEMGLGKTVQAISFIASQRGKKTLVVAPTSLIYNWEAEFKKFAPKTKVLVIHGEKKGREKSFNEINKNKVIITSYGTLKNDIESYKEIEFDFAFIDEAQYIKNHNTKVWEAAKEIRAKNRFALTGTPIENNLMELWAIFDFIMPGYLYSKEEFKKAFLNMGDEGLEELERLIKPFILRRLKRDVLKELPDKIEKNIYLKMTEKQGRQYKEIKKEIIESSSLEIDGGRVLSYITKLRQVCLEPSLINKDTCISGAKLPALMDILENEEENKNKVLVFSQFVSVFEKVKTELNKKNIKYYYLDGKTKPEDRVDLVKRFNSDNEALVFLISLKAGGTGLNLTSASTVIHLDPWWNAAVEAQATDRAHRMGQKNIVTEIKLICKDTIEEEIVKLKESKNSLIEDILNREELKMSKITKEDLLSLIK